MRKRKLIVLYSSTGGGHISVAKAVAAELASRYPGQFDISFIDGFSDCSHAPFKVLPLLYSQFLIFRPNLWRTVFHGLNSPNRFSILREIAWPFFRPKLVQILKSERPDIILSVIHSVNDLVLRAMRLVHIDVPYVVLVIDLINIHYAWISRSAHQYLVPTEPAKYECLRKGINESILKVAGLPVRPEFHRRARARERIREALGLHPDRPTVLVTGGSAGTGRLVEITRVLAEIDQPIQILAVAGWNRALRARLTAITARNPIRVFGFIENMWDLMHASDLILTRASPVTLVEAFTAGVPVILTGALPGQEDDNIAYVVRHEAGRVTTDPAHAAQLVAELLADKGLYCHLRDHAIALGSAQAASHVAQEIGAWTIKRN